MTNEQVYKKAIEVYGEDGQIDMCIEEMSELIKALLKHRRYIYNETVNEEKGEQLVTDIIEEIADVEIMLEQLKIIYKITELNNENKELFSLVKESKIKRLEKNLEETDKDYY